MTDFKEQHVCIKFCFQLDKITIEMYNKLKYASAK
jgi:hypothetical protein